MRVLVACEYSGRVRDAFIAKGHDAWSVDILPGEGNHPEKHHQGDVFHFIKDTEGYHQWDMLIGFPPCTKLSKVGAAHWARWQADGSQQEAINFWLALWMQPYISKIAIENPAGIMTRTLRKPDQYVQPWWFGDPWKKQTGLWLKNLPPLKATKMVEPKGHWVDGGTQNLKGSSYGAHGSYEGASAQAGGNRAKERSKTFQGIAQAMADQWG